MLEGLDPTASQNDDVVDVDRASDTSAAEVLDYWLQKLGCDARCRGKAEGHARTFVFYAVEHEAEVLAVCLCYRQMHVEVGQVYFCHPISAAEHACKRVSALHLEVLVAQERVDRPEIDATPKLVCPFLGHREEC